MALRDTNDAMQAMLLLSDYINDPERGESRILAPVHIRRTGD